ncbi:MAG: rhamnogalacturonan acetylesterase [Lentisphaerae bacterium]|nr:rhamnogalacturonan acetylesterase [Lentisphaerota bacterium]
MMKKFFFALFLLPLLLTAADIYMAGDSTMTNYTKERYPMNGWGMSMQKFCVPGVKVHNRAVGGRSSKSFITEKRWEKLLADAKKGDFVIIQFGINDDASGDKNFYRHTDIDGTYKLYLQIYIAEARARGVIPVLCTQTMFCSFNQKGQAYRSGTVEKRIAACREVAQITGCDFIDLNTYALEKFRESGKEKSLELYMWLQPGQFPNYPTGKKDTCHLQVAGADFYANAFVELAKKQNLPIAKLFK